MDTKTLIVHQSMVNALQKLLQLPNAPVGRYTIDHELNKKRDPDIAEKINNAIRYMTQTEIVLKTLDPSNPTWWLSSRDLPLDEKGEPVVFQQSKSNWVFDLVPVTRASNKAKHQPKESPPEVVEEATLPAGVELSKDDLILHEVLRACGLINYPIEQEHLINILSQSTLDQRFIKMRLAYMCKVSMKLRSWKTSSDKLFYWPTNVSIPDTVVNDLGPFITYTKRVYVRKIKSVDATVEASPFIFHHNSDPVWNIDSKGELKCYVNGECTLSLQPHHALSLRRFLNLVAIDTTLNY